MSGEPIDRFIELLEIENIELPEIVKSCDGNYDRWRNVKNRKAKISGIEVQQVGELFPQYAYWLATGKEIPEAGQISPMTKVAQKSYEKAPKVG
tara:strand:+ start:294 stop:575 length:282 start_codon:yes stop_codon:yes gene_type:complete